VTRYWPTTAYRSEFEPTEYRHTPEAARAFDCAYAATLLGEMAEADFARALAGGFPADMARRVAKTLRYAAEEVEAAIPLFAIEEI
jgi:hypothetical protein